MPDKFITWEDLCGWLENLGMFHMQLGLNRVRIALERLKLIPPAFSVVQIIGTNGKGSTSTFLASLALEHGLRTGLFLSPHFISIEERIKVDGQSVPQALWLECANIVYNLIKSNGPDLTYFEFLTVVAMLIFDRLHVDLGIFEAGLGGQNDATTAIPAHYQGITPIDMDHAHIIGPTLVDIAKDKAAAIHHGSMVFSAAQNKIVADILEIECHKKNASLEFILPMPDLPRPAMRGKMQIVNASLGLALWKTIARHEGIMSEANREAQALHKAFIPGRLQFIAAQGGFPPIILDGAHNPHAMKALLGDLNEKPAAIIFSALADKDWERVLDILNRFADCRFLIPQINNKRAASPADIAALRNRPFPKTAQCFYGDSAFREAFNTAKVISKNLSGPVLVTGSLYLLADFYKLFPQYLPK